MNAIDIFYTSFIGRQSIWHAAKVQFWESFVKAHPAVVREWKSKQYYPTR